MVFRSFRNNTAIVNLYRILKMIKFEKFLFKVYKNSAFFIFSKSNKAKCGFIRVFGITLQFCNVYLWYCEFIMYYNYDDTQPKMLIRLKHNQESNFRFNYFLGKYAKGHFTKVYSIKGWEPQNFSKFPWDPLIGLGCIQIVCLQLNPIGGSQGNFEKTFESKLSRVNFREMAFSAY